MLRLEKCKQLDRLSDSKKNTIKAEIRASSNVTNLIKEVISDRIKHLENTLVTQIEFPYQLAGTVISIQELKTLLKQFDQTEE